MPISTQKILVVDDIRDWRITLQGMLEDAGYQVEVAGSLDESLEKLRGNTFVVAILDMRLDETDEDNRDGLTILAKKIKDEYPNTKTIILTGYADHESVRAMEPDSDGKPLIALHLEKTETNRLICEVKKLLTS